MWHNNRTVVQTYAHHTSEFAWANLDGGIGWKQLKNGAPDGVTNLFVMMNAAKANSRNVNVNIDDAGLITTAYLL